MAKQSALGGQKVNRQPDFNRTDIGRVTKNDRYESHGIIEVVLLDYSKPFPVWVVGDIDRKPMTGDHVIIGYIAGRKDAPYLVGLVKNKSYTTNFIEIDEKHIRIQLPVLEVGKKDGKAHNDTKTFLQDDSKKKERAYIEITSEAVYVYHPTGKVIHHGGTKEVARKGDSVAVKVGNSTYYGTITSGSSKTMID